MPIMRPEVENALRIAGISKKSGQGKSSLEESLDEIGLTLETSLETLMDLQTNGGSEHIRLRAAEAAFKLRGLLKDQQAPPPSITFILQDTKNGGTLDAILVPREIDLT